MINCKRCGTPVPDEKRECQACGEDNGYPNVRLAERTEELNALNQRAHDAEVSATARKCKEVLDRFGTAVLGSKAVIARSLATIQDLVESDRKTYTSYQRQLAQGARVAEDNEFDRVRTQVEAALFPNFQSEMLFGFLALGNTLLTGYGAYAMVLKEGMIAHRTSVFEENLINLARKLRLRLTDPVPPGYRATWGQRHILAKAKLHSEIVPTTSDDQFPAILVKDVGGTGGSDFMEAHIFGPVNRHTIEKLIGPIPRTREDRLILRRLTRQLAELGIPVEAI
jgi:hypothetical protein